MQFPSYNSKIKMKGDDMIRKISIQLFMMVMIIAGYNVRAYSYTMADYWAFNKGNVWVYDRDLQVMGTETHAFASYTGRQFLQGREFCNNQPYIYSGPEGVMAVGMFIFETKEFLDLSATPIKLSDAQMDIGQSITNNIPAGILDEDAISIVVTLEGAENVSVFAGTFFNTLRMSLVINDSVGTYAEKIWLAKDVGVVKMFREYETNKTPGCFFTCGSFGCDSQIIEERNIELKSFIKGGQKGVVIIPLE
jgi:hypothetical protein